MPALRLLTAPVATGEPVTLAELKAQLRITHFDEESLIAAYGKAARQWAENYCQRSFFTQTWNYFADEFPCGAEPIVIGRGQYASVSSFTYKDSASVSQTLTASDYQVSAYTDPFKVYPALNDTWPVTDRSINNVNFRFVAGWSTVAAIPQEIKQAILMLASHWYTYREPIVTGTSLQNVPLTVEALLSPWKIWNYV